MTIRFSGYRAVVLICIISIFTTASIGAYAILLPTATARLGASYAEMGTAATVETFCTFVGSILAGPLYNRLGYRPIFATAVIVVSTYVLTYQFANHIAEIYFIEVVYGLLLGIAAYNGAAAFTATWFIEHRERMLGIVLGIVGAGTAVGSIAITSLTQLFNQDTAVTIMASIGIPVLGLVLLLRTPAQLGQKPLGEAVHPKGAEDGDPLDAVSTKGITRRAVLTPSFILMLVAALVLGSLYFGSLYMSLIMQDLGVAPVLAGNLVSIALATTSLTCIGLGFVAQRGGPFAYMGTGFALAIAGAIVWLTWSTGSRNAAGAIIVAILIGAATGLAITYAATLVSSVFSPESYTRVMPIIASTVILGYGFAVGILPALAQGAGSWTPVLVIVLISVVVAAVATAAALALAPARRRQGQTDSAQGHGTTTGPASSSTTDEVIT